MIRTIASALTLVVCSLLCSQASADRRVTVHDFYGPNADRVRDDVVNLLERQSGVTIVSKGQIEASAEKLGVDPFAPEGRIALGRELQLSAWMTGVVQRRSGKLKLTVAVFDGAQHMLVGRARLSGNTVSGLSAQIRDHLWRKTRAALLRAEAPVDPNAPLVAAPEPLAPPAAAAAPAEGAPPADMVVSTNEAEAPAPAETRAATSEASEDAPASSNAETAVAVAEPDYEEGDDPTPKRGEVLRAFLGFGSPYRSLAYDSPITSSLGDYQMSGAPMLDLNVAFHPARPFTSGWASWLGLDARAQLTLSTPTVDRNGHKFDSRYGSYHLGVRARVPVGQHYVSAFSGYAVSSLLIRSQDQNVTLPTPSVEYQMIRSGAGGEFALGRAFQLGVDAAWLAFLGVGDIGHWFPRATAGGLELSGFATYGFTAGLFGRVSVNYQRVFFDFNPRPDDQYAAQGATDQVLSLSLGAGVKL